MIAVLVYVVNWETNYFSYIVSVVLLNKDFLFPGIAGDCGTVSIESRFGFWKQ